jgi:hypothetical protein
MMTIEMLFACDHCKTRRQYGNGESLLDKPENRTPMLFCETCQSTMWHSFFKAALRTPEREEVVSRSLIKDRYLTV